MFEVPSLGDLNVAATLPVTLLALGACIFLLVDLFIPKDRKYITAGLALVGLGVSLVIALLSLGDAVDLGNGEDVFSGMYIADRFTDVTRSEKWFRRNCNDVVGRECTAAEKADVLAWLLTLQP